MKMRNSAADERWGMIRGSVYLCFWAQFGGFFVIAFFLPLSSGALLWMIRLNRAANVAQISTGTGILCLFKNPKSTICTACVALGRRRHKNSFADCQCGAPLVADYIIWNWYQGHNGQCFGWTLGISSHRVQLNTCLRRRSLGWEQRSAKVRAPGFVNAAVKFRQKW